MNIKSDANVIGDVTIDTFRNSKPLNESEITNIINGSPILGNQMLTDEIKRQIVSGRLSDKSDHSSIECPDDLKPEYQCTNGRPSYFGMNDIIAPQVYKWVRLKEQEIQNMNEASMSGLPGINNSLYGELTDVFSGDAQQTEFAQCVNNIFQDDADDSTYIDKIQNAGGDITEVDEETLYYIESKLRKFTTTSDEEVKRCFMKLYENKESKICSEPLNDKLLRMIRVLFSLVAININLDEIDKNERKYTKLIHIIHKMGKVFYR